MAATEAATSFGVMAFFSFGFAQGSLVKSAEVKGFFDPPDRVMGPLAIAASSCACRALWMAGCSSSALNMTDHSTNSSELMRSPSSSTVHPSR